MDFMKVFNQTVREIKREVNLKVLNVPEIEQKVLDATDDAPWGPHGTALAEIAQATRKFTECQMIMNVLWTRLQETGKDWRLVYKALTVIEYLIAHGSERSVDDIIEHTFQISSLSSFEYVEPNGKDSGLNVRKKSEVIVSLLNNKEKIEEVRNKASANRDKYIGLSSSGITYKSGSATCSGSSFRSSERYGGIDGDSFGRYRGRDKHREEKNDNDTYKSHNNHWSTLKKGSTQFVSKDQNNKSSRATKSSTKINESSKIIAVPSQHADTAGSNYIDDADDDFDPRGNSCSKLAAEKSSQVDLFGQSSLIDLMDEPTSLPTETSAVNSHSSGIDLFAAAAFVSAPPQVGRETSLLSQEDVDLFAPQPAITSAVPSSVDLFSIPSSVAQAETNASKPGPSITSNVHLEEVDLFASQPVITAVPSTVDLFSNPGPVVQAETETSKPDPSIASNVDPFVTVESKNFDGSDLLGLPASGPATTESSRSSVNDSSLDNLDQKSLEEPKPTQKEAFQVKSGVWADSLSRGLIDLNISAPNKVSLVDVGVVGNLNEGVDEREKGFPASFFMGTAMGIGSGLGRSSYTSQSQATDGVDFFSTLGSQQYQFGNFQK